MSLEGFNQNLIIMPLELYISILNSKMCPYSFISKILNVLQDPYIQTLKWISRYLHQNPNICVFSSLNSNPKWGSTASCQKPRIYP